MSKSKFPYSAMTITRLSLLLLIVLLKCNKRIAELTFFTIFTVIIFGTFATVPNTTVFIFYTHTCPSVITLMNVATDIWWIVFFFFLLFGIVQIIGRVVKLHIFKLLYNWIKFVFTVLRKVYTLKKLCGDVRTVSTIF